MIKTQDIENLFLRLLEGEKLSDEEMSSVKKWMADNPDKAKEYESYSLIWNGFDVLREVSNKDVENDWNKIKAGYLNKRNGILLFSRGMLKYAAIFIAGILLSSLFFILKPDEEISTQIVEVPYGAKSTIQLSDGSEIILNAGSKLEYNTRFNKKDRKVKLVGEAFFKVAKDKTKPFTVVTNNMTIKAYGTVFDVKAYPGEKYTEATLIEGSIGINLNNKKNHSNEIFLKPNERIVYIKPENSNSKGKLLIAKNIKPDLYTSWVDGNINVRSKTLKELAVQLERKYNVNIYIMDKDLESKRFTGLLKNETIEQILQVLKLSAHIDYKIENRDIWLYNEKTDVNN